MKSRVYSEARRKKEDGVYGENEQIASISEIDPGNECHRESLANFFVSLRFSPDPLKGRTKCKEIYDTILDKQGGDVHKTDLFFYRLLTDGEAASYFYGHIDRDLGSRFEEWFKAFTRSHDDLASCQSQWYFKYIIGPVAEWFRVIISTVTHYFDIVKDILLVLVLAGVVSISDDKEDQEKMKEYNESESMSRKVVILLCIVSLLASEMSKIFLVISSRCLSAKMRWFGTIFSPLLPAFLYHRDWRFRALRRETVDGLENNWAHAFRDHLMMLTAPLEIAPDTDMILTWTRNKLRQSSIIKAELRATENFLEHYIQLTLLSTLTWIYYDPGGVAYTRLSSEVIGDNLNLVILSATISLFSLLRGQVNLVSTLKRAGPKALVLLCLYFALGTLTRVTAAMMYMMPVLHGSPITMDMVIKDWSFWLCMVTVHLVVSFSLLTWFYDGVQSKRKRFLQSSWTLLCPPLFIDWETLHRLKKYKMPIEVCWKRSRIIFLSHNLLMVTENMVMCLASVFVRDWKWGNLRFVSMVLFPLIQMCMIALAYQYFWQGHLWSRIVREYPLEWLTRLSERSFRAHQRTSQNGGGLNIQVTQTTPQVEEDEV